MQSRNRVGHCGFDNVESNVIGQWIRCRLETGESVPECQFGEWMTGSVARQLVPTRLAAWMQPFAAAFTAPSWQHVLVLIVGAILAPGRRPVAAALRVVGLENDPHFTNYHRVLNRNQWLSRWLARCLLRLLIDAFVPTGPVVIGLDDTLERRWGEKMPMSSRSRFSGACPLGYRRPRPTFTQERQTSMRPSARETRVRLVLGHSPTANGPVGFKSRRQLSRTKNTIPAAPAAPGMRRSVPTIVGLRSSSAPILDINARRSAEPASCGA
jgi:hypothetical protein